MLYQDLLLCSDPRLAFALISAMTPESAPCPHLARFCQGFSLEVTYSFNWFDRHLGYGRLSDWAISIERQIFVRALGRASEAV